MGRVDCPTLSGRAYGIADVKKRDAREEDEDEENGVRFAAIQSRFQNKETVGKTVLLQYKSTYVIRRRKRFWLWRI